MVVTRREFMTGTGAVLATSRTVKGFPFIVQPAALKVGVFISERDAQGVDELLVPYVSQMRIGLELAASETRWVAFEGEALNSYTVTTGAVQRLVVRQKPSSDKTDVRQLSAVL